MVILEGIRDDAPLIPREDVATPTLEEIKSLDMTIPGDLIEIIAQYLDYNHMLALLAAYPNATSFVRDLYNPNAVFWSNRMAVITGRGGLVDASGMVANPSLLSKEARQGEILLTLRAQHDAMISRPGYMYVGTTEGSRYISPHVVGSSRHVQAMANNSSTITIFAAQAQDMSAGRAEDAAVASEGRQYDLVALWDDGTVRYLHEVVPTTEGMNATTPSIRSDEKVRRLVDDDRSWHHIKRHKTVIPFPPPANMEDGSSPEDDDSVPLMREMVHDGRSNNSILLDHKGVLWVLIHPQLADEDDTPPAIARITPHPTVGPIKHINRVGTYDKPEAKSDTIILTAKDNKEYIFILMRDYIDVTRTRADQAQAEGRPVPPDDGTGPLGIHTIVPLIYPVPELATRVAHSIPGVIPDYGYGPGNKFDLRDANGEPTKPLVPLAPYLVVRSPTMLYNIGRRERREYIMNTALSLYGKGILDKVDSTTAKMRDVVVTFPLLQSETRVALTDGVATEDNLVDAKRSLIKSTNPNAIRTRGFIVIPVLPKWNLSTVTMTNTELEAIGENMGGLYGKFGDWWVGIDPPPETLEDVDHYDTAVAVERISYGDSRDGDWLYRLPNGTVYSYQPPIIRVPASTVLRPLVAYTEHDMPIAFLDTLLPDDGMHRLPIWSALSVTAYHYYRHDISWMRREKQAGRDYASVRGMDGVVIVAIGSTTKNEVYLLAA